MKKIGENVNMENMTAKVSCFARAFHYKNNGFWVFKDETAEKLLGTYEYQAIADRNARAEKYKLSYKTETQEIPCDLAKDSLQQKLEERGFDKTKKTFGSLLGICYYLTKEDFQNLLNEISKIMPENSAICLDFPLEETGTESEKNRMLAKAANEQMKAKYSYEEMETLLATSGFQICEYLDANKMTEEYFKAYNLYNPKHTMKAPEGVGYLFAEKKER